jgi:hypothetical protein
MFAALFLCALAPLREDFLFRLLRLKPLPGAGLLPANEFVD